MKITIITGAHPNFMKIAPIIHAVEKAKGKGKNINYRLNNSCLHYYKKMSSYFFSQLKIIFPVANLRVVGDNQAVRYLPLRLLFFKIIDG